nr:helix-turn-helix domain-containing protein [Aestuariivirga sp. YIM B02566]
MKAIKRVERGEGVLPVARDLGVTRKALHDWVRAYKALGPEGLNRKRGPKPGRRRLKPVPDVPIGEGRGALAVAHHRIAELERVIGRQQLELDFFSTSLACHGREGHARQTRTRLAEVVKEMIATNPTHEAGHLCRLAGLSRATYYRHLERTAPNELDHDLQEAIQHISRQRSI